MTCRSFVTNAIKPFESLSQMASPQLQSFMVFLNSCLKFKKLLRFVFLEKLLIATSNSVKCVTLFFVDFYTRG